MMKRFAVILLALGGLVLLAAASISLRVGSYSSGRVYSGVESVPEGNAVAIVLGARVENDGVTPSDTLYDRTLAGVELYKAGKVSKLLLSGGNREPEVMKRLAVELGVPEGDIAADDLGVRTLESCRRAKQAFGIDKAVVVTQDYHLPRAIYLCRSFGVEAIGLDAKRREYLGERYAWLREYVSRVKAWYDVDLGPASGAAEQ